MVEETQWTQEDDALAQAQINFSNFLKKLREDSFHAGFQAGTQEGIKAVVPAVARAMRESADKWPYFPAELVYAFADLMEHQMAERLAEMIPNAAETEKARP